MDLWSQPGAVLREVLICVGSSLPTLPPLVGPPPRARHAVYPAHLRRGGESKRHGNVSKRKPGAGGSYLSHDYDILNAEERRPINDGLQRNGLIYEKVLQNGI